MARYAEKTTVTADRSQAELRQLIMRFGADKFLIGEITAPPRQFVMFEKEGRQYRLEIPVPALEDFEESPSGRLRSDADMERARKAEIRRLWRALVHVVKAILVGVTEGLWSFEEAMVPTFGLLPDQRTVREALVDQVDGFLAHGMFPPLLPPARGDWED